jgi:hypothetical protein
LVFADYFGRGARLHDFGGEGGVGGASLRLIAEVLGEAAGDVLAGVGTWCSGVGESMTYAGDDLTAFLCRYVDRFEERN